MSDVTYDQELIDKLELLIEKTNEACTSAADNMSEFQREPINWSDLGCVDSEYCITSNGGCVYRVYIEEADPSCSVFIKFVEEYLSNNDFENVEVVTNW